MSLLAKTENDFLLTYGQWPKFLSEQRDLDWPSSTECTQILRSVITGLNRKANSQDLVDSLLSSVYSGYLWSRSTVSLGCETYSKPSGPWWDSCVKIQHLSLCLEDNSKSRYLRTQLLKPTAQTYSSATEETGGDDPVIIRILWTNTEASRNNAHAEAGRT